MQNIMGGGVRATGKKNKRRKILGKRTQNWVIKYKLKISRRGGEGMIEIHYITYERKPRKIGNESPGIIHKIAY